MLTISSQELKSRRRALQDALGHDDTIYMTAHRRMQRRSDAAYPFAQEANFRYLTGLTEPDWRVLITPDETLLIRPELDEIQKLFDGYLEDELALQISGADGVISQFQATERIKYKDANAKIWTLKPFQDETMAGNPAQAQLHDELKTLGVIPADCRRELMRLRAIKSEAEIACITKAVNDTMAAFEAVRQRLATYHYEHEIEADMTQVLRRRGATGHAYDPIVAAGQNACTLHYGANNSTVRSGDFVLIDVGGEVEGYAADLTRTYATGQPTVRQQAVHDAVTSAQKDIIELLGPGQSVRDYVEQADARMAQALIELGLMREGDNADVLRRCYPHATSHGLGLDVHDSLGAPTEFQAGMVLTVEPGIYIKSENIGVRIEDDIVITESGALSLSQALSTHWS